MRKIHLDNLPRRKEGIDWNRSVGHTVKFNYDDINGEFKLLKYENKKITFEYLNQEFTMPISTFIYAQISYVLGILTTKHKIPTGTIYKTNRSDIYVLEHTYIQRKHGKGKAYKCICLTCNSTFITEETGILNRNQGCKICKGHEVKKGFNDMWTTNANLANLLLNSEDGYIYTACSTKKVNWKCLSCGNIIKNKKISHVHNRGLACPICCDGLSYPEKILSNILHQTGIDFEREKVFNWSKTSNIKGVTSKGFKFYDFYIPSINCIIEVNGVQHYSNTFSSYVRGRSLTEEVLNDALKKEIALKNSITNYIIIDASESDLEYIKDKILKSKLSELIDLSKIDWDRCDRFSTKSIIFDICNLWNQNKNSTEIGNILKVSQTTVVKFLNHGSKLNLCNYSKDNAIKRIKRNSKKVTCVTTNKVFNSLKDASYFYNISAQGISSNCRGRIKYSGLHPKTKKSLVWEYVQ